MPDIRHLILIQAPVDRIAEAVTTAAGMRAWWTTEVDETSASPRTLVLHFGPSYFKELRLMEQGRTKVRWHVLQADKEWVDTDIVFNFRESDNHVKVFFEHTAWRDYTDLYSQCSFDWTIFLRSLKSWCEKGKGKPFPDYQD